MSLMAGDAALAAEEAGRRAANAVHDMLSVLRAVSLAGRSPPWSLVVSKAQGP